MRLLTFNVEGFQTLQLNHKLDPENIINELVERTHADIVAIQEDLAGRPIHDFLKSSCARANTKKAGSWFYMHVTFCDGEQYLTGLGAMRNSLFVKKNTGWSIRRHTLDTLDITSRCSVPRCATTMIVNGYTISNVHLCGGRFDDQNFQTFLYVKKNELEVLIDKVNPDILVGDFNGELTKDKAKSTLSKYDIYQRANKEQKEKFLTYYMSCHEYLKAVGYEPAYYESQVKKTSVYGGVPDWVYIKKGLGIIVRRVDVIDTTHKHVLQTHDIREKRACGRVLVTITYRIRFENCMTYRCCDITRESCLRCSSRYTTSYPYRRLYLSVCVYP